MGDLDLLMRLMEPGLTAFINLQFEWFVEGRGHSRTRIITGITCGGVLGGTEMSHSVYMSASTCSIVEFNEPVMQNTTY